MKTSLRLLLPAVGLTLLVGSLSAQTITSITATDGPHVGEAKGRIGTMVSIVGTGFDPTGVAKAAASFLDPATQKTLALKVISTTDTLITALITKAVYGTLDVRVQPVGAALIVLEDGFEVPLPTITGITPVDESGTIGTTVVISGTGLGGLKVNGKAKVVLQTQGVPKPKKFSLKVTVPGDTSITAVITKATAGSLDLIVTPKGAAPLVASSDFTVPLPNISLVAPGFAFAGESVTLTCQYVGNKTPKVKVGGKGAKVTGFTDTQVTFLMTKKLAKGVQTIVLTNKVGTATQNPIIINQGDVPDTSTESLVSAKVGKQVFVAGGGGIFGFIVAITGEFDDGPPPTVSIDGRKLTEFDVTEAALTVVIPFDPGAFAGEPVAFVDAADGKVEYAIPNPDFFDALIHPFLARWSSDASGGSYSIAVLSTEAADGGGTLIRGAFSGTLKLVEVVDGFAAADTLAVINGEVRVVIDTM